MKKDKKGFTLIELLAVIVILAIIALIAIPTVMNIISKANKSAFKDSAYGIIKAGELYYADHLLEVNGMENDEEFIFPDNIGNLQIKGSMPSSGNMIVSRRGQIAIAISNGKYCVRKGYTDNDVTMDEDIENCKTKEIVNPISVTNINIALDNITLNVGEEKTITATIEPNNATIKTLKWSSLVSSIATVDDSGKVRAIKKGTTIIKVETTDGSNINKTINVIVKQPNPNISSTNNCIKNSSVCPNGTLVNVKVNDSENYDFYVIKDTGSELTLIMNKNLGSRIAWITQADYTAAGGTNYGSNGNTEKGPLTALKALEERTSSWSNVPAYTYTLTDDGGGNKYQPITRSNVRARMLTKTEANTLGCTSSSNSCPNYLYTNTSSSNTETSPLGYWLSSALSSSSNAGWIANHSGYSIYLNVSSGSSYGSRPVITLSKNV